MGRDNAGVAVFWNRSVDDDYAGFFSFFPTETICEWTRMCTVVVDYGLRV